jgi:hypothetical protein
MLMLAVGTVSSLFKADRALLVARQSHSQQFVEHVITDSVRSDALRVGALCFLTRGDDPFDYLFVDSPRAYALLRWGAPHEMHDALRNTPVFFGRDADQGKFPARCATISMPF